MEKLRHAAEISAQDQLTTPVSKSLALKGKSLIPVPMAQLLGRASCRNASFYLLHVSLICTSASLVSGPLNLDLFFISASQKQAKSQRQIFEGFLLLYIISVLPGGFRDWCMPWGFFFPRCLLLVNILIDAVGKCQKTSLHNRNSHCSRSV